MQHEIADSFFNEPVDPEELEIPEYRDIIKARHAWPCGRCQAGLCCRTCGTALHCLFKVLPCMQHPAWCMHTSSRKLSAAEAGLRLCGVQLAAQTCRAAAAVCMMLG